MLAYLLSSGERCPLSDLLARITIDPNVVHGRPCIRGLRVTVSDILGLLSSSESQEAILLDYPYLESADIDAALAFAGASCGPSNYSGRFRSSQWRLATRTAVILMSRALA